MNLDERLAALTMNLELMSGMVKDLLTNSERDGASIRALARIAEIHERRITTLEGGEPNGERRE